ncbi:MAG: hypothetical protein ABGY75_08535 [Gemmataceae bacterium]
MKQGLLYAVLALTTAGCGTARYIQKGSDGGVIAMPADNRWNREKAVELIKAHVGPGYRVVEEKEVVTGQETTNLTNTQTEPTVHSQIPFLPAQKQTSTLTTTSRDLTEWHIVYQRGNAPPAATQPVQQTGGQHPATK